ncbi:hypothetical protein BJ684DRAFT_20029 [Piptocephalis cylindrospora]|uniref:RING-type domain-containing protein n=1 Tax=Piptocephalis cylindrospora TaxID=1907219 RepID=A0A4P9Y3N0_9FUNG|nr:hypothetical protein BJ684DRAFT_20029 [Piptocephalis cylindrospora]|eukprot:RKP13485.1 hypothetical protein BJ684DRAFT_20029 [Piptocephalis cylindrospora]
MGNVLTKKPFHLTGHPSDQERHRTCSPSPTARIDQGYFVPQTTLYSAESRDYHVGKVHHLQLSRRLAPFYAGRDEADLLSDPPSKEPFLPPALHRSASADHLTLPSSDLLPSSDSLSVQSPCSGPHLSPPSNSLTVRSSHSAPPYRPLMPYLAFTVECPICFLYYPSNVNMTTCCRTVICTECFLQIRPFPNDSGSSSSPYPTTSCPYCVSSPFSITYTPPSFSSTTQSEAGFPARSGTGGVADLFRSDRRMAQHQDRARRAMSLLLDPSTSSSVPPATARQMNRYLTSAQALGVDIEEMMMAEAIRRSLLASESGEEGSNPSVLRRTEEEGGEGDDPSSSSSTSGEPVPTIPVPTIPSSSS